MMGLLDPRTWAGIGLVALLLSGGAYIKGRGDGKAVASAACETRVAKIKDDYAKDAALLQTEFNRRQAALAQELDRQNKQVVDLIQNEEQLREIADGYAAEIAARPDNACVLSPEDVKKLQ